MSVFHFFSVNKGVNIGNVREISIANNNAVHITFNNGDTEIYNTRGDASGEIEDFGRKIVQLIPNAAPFYNVYEESGGGYIHERVDYFVLCADGIIRSLASAEMFFELADDLSNFKGFFSEDMLGEYPKSDAEPEPS
jgi:hypothetical protein